jgi:hypothetical protein
MKVSIQRHGIVIRSVEVKGDRARIGNTPECEILIDDAYLSAHVADFVNVDGVWRIIDAGRLEGIHRAGVRIEDEPVADGATYSVGGFELVLHLGSPAPAAFHVPAPPTERPLTPETQLSVPLPAHPQPPRPEPRPEQPRALVTPADLQQQPSSQAFRPAPVVVPAEGAPGAVAPARSKRVVLLAAAFGAGLIVLIIVLLTMTGKKPAPAATKAKAPQAPAASVEPATAAGEIRAGERALAALDYDHGLQHWEAALKLSPDAALQRRYADVAVEVGRAFLAKGESERGRSYLQKAIDLGPADAESVQLARRVLQQALSR